MATKNNPGSFDCYKNADPDEPMFVLLGRDPTASTLVRAWIALREHLAAKGVIIRNEQQIGEAYLVAETLERYAQALGKEKAIDELRELDPLGPQPLASDTQDAPNTGHPHD